MEQSNDRVTSIDNVLEQIKEFYFDKNPLIQRVLINVTCKAKFGPKPSVFSSLEYGEWVEIRASFSYPLTFTSIEESILSAINSERNINAHYFKTKDIKIVGVDRISEKGYSLGELGRLKF